MKGANLSLFNDPDPLQTREGKRSAPLSDRIRPSDWERFYGVEKLDKHLISQLKKGAGRPPSLLLWGPPGSGKTTLAKLIGRSFKANFIEFSAVLHGVKELREIVSNAKKIPLPTILFVDEIHRFNKGQQDSFLPHIEDGTFILIGATTENPSFYLTSPLLSRMRVLVIPTLSEEALYKLSLDAEKATGVTLSDDARSILIQYSGGDGRKLGNLIEALSNALDQKEISGDNVKSYLKESATLFYDRSGEEHYNMASAFIKSMRGSDPDAALYWGFRMIESGEDPRFIIRRMIIFASEDIGNADPSALQLAVATAEAFDRVGLPEGRIPIAQCITYLASAPKSNRSYVAMNKVIEAIKEDPKAPVPLHLRNAPTKLLKSLSYGEGYQYPHDHEGGYVEGVQYLPDKLKDTKFYQPEDKENSSRSNKSKV